ncbi:MAG: phosphoenolpyruvate carboxykinase (ATP) [Candidatus Caenarcaniphilales bacterium]|nr:phosphoenolpyruvate carboxykinase (ATP) [Candidatus Caenarcaniphilales bacterium]
MNKEFTLDKYNIKVKTIYRNASAAFLYEKALKEPTLTKNSTIASSGALIAYSGRKTGRSPQDKRVVEEETSKNNVWWGKVNIPLSEESFGTNLEIAKNFLGTREQLYVVDGYAGWSLKTRIKCRIICARPYHALFMNNMLIRPTEDELKDFGDPEWVVYNAGQCPSVTHVAGVTSHASVDLNIKSKEFVILGTEYAGEMKKGIFSVMNYILPLKNILSMHCSANEGENGDIALFFGLSGTGKTTLSADPERKLIGDDEHGWDEEGIFNFEGGCYAKAIKLRQETEPEIWNAIQFGSVLENVVFDEYSKKVDYDDVSITENTRVSYPIEYIDNAKIPCVGKHPKNVIFLTCDAYGVLPPISKLNPEQAMYHYISGYTAKVAGTEVGVTEPEATFSACFGAAFLVWHPMKYAEILREKMKKHNVNVWLVNTGWSGGSYGVGNRFSLKYTRAIITAALNGSLDKVDYVEDPVFGFQVPTHCPNVPEEILIPKKTWQDKSAYDETLQKLAIQFNKNFEQFKDQATKEVIEAGPKVFANK